MEHKRDRFSKNPLDQTAEKYLNSKNPSTAGVYKVCLKRFTAYYGRPLGDYIREIESQIRENEGKPLVERIRPGEDTARGFIKWMAEQGYANKSARQAMAAVQNYLKYYGVTLSYGFVEMPANQPQPRNDKHQWTLDEMRQLVNACEYIRDKAMVLTAFQSGLGASDLVSLNYGDVHRELESETMPLMVKLFRKKSGVEFRTFLGRDAVTMIKEYLKSRRDLRNDSPLFTMLGSEKRVTKHAFQKQLRVVAPKLPFILDVGDLDNGEAGFNPARPHSLRSAFRSRLTGKMADTLIEFMLGHDIGEEKRAYLNMPPEELRAIYANYEHLLAIESTSKDDASRKQPQPIPPEIASRIANLETSVINLTERNTGLEEKVDKLGDILTALIQGNDEDSDFNARLAIILSRMSSTERKAQLKKFEDADKKYPDDKEKDQQ